MGIHFLWKSNVGTPEAGAVIHHSCLSCGALISTRESYCTKHRPRRRANALRGGGGAIARFRRELFRIARGQCEVVERGVRCGERNPEELEAHHLRAVGDGGSNDPVSNGLLVCKRHHALLEGRRPASTAVR